VVGRGNKGQGKKPAVIDDKELKEGGGQVLLG